MGDYARGTRIPGTQYEVEGVLGTGGWGTVYLVRHTFLGARFAMKILLSDRGESAERMTAEAKALAAIRHTNVVEVTDGGLTAETPPRPYFVMPVLNGKTLNEALSQLPQGTGLLRGLSIIIALLDGLYHVHSQHNIIHRDLKPGNIFLHVAGAKTTPKILDFGIAHFMSDRARRTGKWFLGTVKYAAPEQLRGETPSPQTDLYAMGLLLYECICGRGPFADLGRDADIMRAHLERPPPRPSSFMHQVPEELEDIILAMLAKDPKARPSDAGTLAIRLRELNIAYEKHAVQANATDPTPLDTALIGYSEGSGDAVTGRVSYDATTRRAELVDTIRDLPMGGSRTLVSERVDRQALVVTGREPSVNRAAPTPTMHEGPPSMPKTETVIAPPEDNVYAPIEQFLPPPAPPDVVEAMAVRRLSDLTPQTSAISVRRQMPTAWQEFVGSPFWRSPKKIATMILVGALCGAISFVFVSLLFTVTTRPKRAPAVSIEAGTD